jgi:hypothetical protein
VCHSTLLDSRFYDFLQCIDDDEAARTRAGRCRCGGVLHNAPYRRKPRGGPRDLGVSYQRRLSFTCYICKGRSTPFSVRFFGRRVYLAAVVVLASALRAGLSDRRVQQLTDEIKVPRRTLERWRAWWLYAFVKTPFWKAARAQFMPPLEPAALPVCLLERFTGPDPPSQLASALRFLSPLSTLREEN